MIRKLLLLSALWCICFQSAFAQPQVYNRDTGTGSTFYSPFWVKSTEENKMQTILLPEMIPYAVSDTIKAIYFIADQPTPPGTIYTLRNVTLLMGYTTATAYPDIDCRVYFPNLDTVRTRDSFQVPLLAKRWIKIDLDRPFYYDHTKTLVIQATTYAPAGGFGFPLGYYKLLGGNYVVWGNIDTVRPQATGYPTICIGLDLAKAPPIKYNDAAFARVASPVDPICPSANVPVSVIISNAGHNQISSLKLSWFVDGIKQPDVNVGFIDTFAGTSYSFKTVPVGTVNFLTQAQHTLKFYTWNPNGTTDTYTANDTQTVVLNAGHVPITPAGPVYACGSTVNVVFTPTTCGTNYVWKKGNTVVSSSSSFTPYTATGFGTYTLTTTINGCDFSTSVLVDSIPAFVKINAPHPYICFGDTLKLKVDATLPGFSYQWKESGAVIAGGTDTILPVYAPGRFTLTASYGMCSVVSDTVNIISRPRPTPVITNIANILHTDTTGIKAYQWYINNGTATVPIAGDTNNNCIPKVTGDYIVKVFNGGCWGTSSPYKVDSNLLSIDNSNILSYIHIYPNPAHTLLHVDAPANTQISITSIDGKILLQQPVQKNIDISRLPGALYIIRITDKNGMQLHMEKLTKLD